ncbi:type II toxin-antitoxin system HicA family toxin [Patescibacteria group bacterium]|nr:type II toxin-antitoxin system HicA family toxin [Patescibacteria group bacterium]MCG2694948.1 type II toxin-antitoxin system HicA family toxin [Candidatus Parcubacteria bacterium]
MPKQLPIISGKKTAKKLEKIGYVIARQKGSHLRLINDAKINCKPITIPLHKELKLGLLNQILKDADLSVKQFLEL